MWHPRRRGIDVHGRRKPYSPLAAMAAVIVLGFLGALAPAGALDYTGRIDTRYQWQTGDNAYDNDIYNYHSLELAFSKSLTFSWYGGLIASLNNRVNTLSADGIEVSDNALRTLQDTGNPGQYINYSIYSAFLKYDTGVFGAMLGRCNPVDYDLTTFDGLDLWGAPFPWLRVEAFGGMPWHYAYVANPAIFSQYWTAGEVAAGGGADLRFFDEALTFSVKYLFPPGSHELERVDLHVPVDVPVRGQSHQGASESCTLAMAERGGGRVGTRYSALERPRLGVG